MGDSEDNKQVPLVPSWQQVVDNSVASTESILDRARRFLAEETVKDSNKEQKVEFLKSKGLEEADIIKLLEESNNTATAAQTTPSQPSPQPAPETTIQPLASFAPEGTITTNTKPDQPPIVTYPEFLTRPLKPPPLITAAGLLNALTGIAATSTLVYGATKHLVSPMVTTLTQARVDLHTTANANLTALVDKLEHAVSELPAGYHNITTTSSSNKADSVAAAAAGDDNTSIASSAYDDPSELFHRDVGVQTSPPPSPLPSYLKTTTTTTTFNSDNPPLNNPAAQTAHQATRLSQLNTSVRTLSAGVVHQTEELAATMGELEALGTDLHALTYPPESFGAGSSYIYGPNKNEPDDEIRRVKTSIRGVKGVLLSTRSFPATTR
ncbi:unnamed protein product [Discula destructiva]